MKRCRACTDVPMLALWIASWIAIVGVFLVAHKRGADPNLYDGTARALMTEH